MHKRLTTFLIAAFFLAAGLEAAPKNRFSFGLYTGWSFGLGYEFGWHTRPSRSDDYTLDLHLGGYAQCNISDVVGVQLNVNYQHGTNDWEFNYPGFPHDEGTDPIKVFSFNLNGVFNVLRLKGMDIYVLGGGGITTGDLESLNGTYFNLITGAGIRVFLSKSHPRIALNLGGTFHHLFDPGEYSGYSADYLRFQGGIEL
jgi:hypothetical protein